MKTIDPYAETSLRDLRRRLVVPMRRRPLLRLRQAVARTTRQGVTSTYVLRVRLPRDRSFIYARIDRERGSFKVEMSLIRRRYYCARRFELMRFGGTR